jgi:hypothetical protein
MEELKEIDIFNNGYIYVPYVPLQIIRSFLIKRIVICAWENMSYPYPYPYPLYRIPSIWHIPLIKIIVICAWENQFYHQN